MKLSLVVPIHNEAENVGGLYREIVESLKRTEYEILFVDDGSSDKSLEVLKKIARKDKKVKVIEFLRNFGQTAAMAAGIKESSGELIVTLDGDGQNNPGDIIKMVESIKGVDLVSGYRKNRKDPFWRSFFSKLANQLINIITGTKLHDTGCSLKVYKRECFDNFTLYGEMHRFIPALLLQKGFKAREIEVDHRPRVKGKSHYGMSRIFKVILDLLSIKFMDKFSTKPIHVFGGSGLMIFFLGGLSGVFVVYRKIFWGGEWVSPMMFVTMLLVMVGFQFIFMGFLAEMITKSSFENSQKLPYKIKARVNL
jgi:glycosyltransferase involved in cell wall biosynthesis